MRVFILTDLDRNAASSIAGVFTSKEKAAIEVEKILDAIREINKERIEVMKQALKEKPNKTVYDEGELLIEEWELDSANGGLIAIHMKSAFGKRGTEITTATEWTTTTVRAG